MIKLEPMPGCHCLGCLTAEEVNRMRDEIEDLKARIEAMSGVIAWAHKTQMLTMKAGPINATLITEHQNTKTS